MKGIKQEAKALPFSRYLEYGIPTKKGEEEYREREGGLRILREVLHGAPHALAPNTRRYSNQT